MKNRKSVFSICPNCKTLNSNKSTICSNCKANLRKGRKGEKKENKKFTMNQ